MCVVTTAGDSRAEGVHPCISELKAINQAFKSWIYDICAGTLLKCKYDSPFQFILLSL